MNLILWEFRSRRGLLPAIGNRPSEQTLSLSAKSREKQSVEFRPLIRVSNFSDGRGVKAERAGIKGAAILADNGASVTNQKNREFLSSSEAFRLSVRVVMRGYAPVSMLGPPGV